MKRIEAIIRPLRLEAVKSALAETGVTGLTVSDVRGSGRGGGQTGGTFRGEEYILRLPPKIKLEMTVLDEEVEPIVNCLLEFARTGDEGDGWIFVLPGQDALRIRTGETGDASL